MRFSRAPLALPPEPVMDTLKDLEAARRLKRKEKEEKHSRKKVSKDDLEDDEDWR